MGQLGAESESRACKATVPHKRREASSAIMCGLGYATLCRSRGLISGKWPEGEVPRCPLPRRCWGRSRHQVADLRQSDVEPDEHQSPPQLSTFSAAMNASCGMSTLPNCRIFFLPSAFPEASACA